MDLSPENSEEADWAGTWFVSEPCIPAQDLPGWPKGLCDSLTLHLSSAQSLTLAHSHTEIHREVWAMPWREGTWVKERDTGL